jgi:hypothetical protein
MNDPEVTMLDAFPTNDLIVYRKAISAAGEAISLASRVPAPPPANRVPLREGG